MGVPTEVLGILIAVEVIPDIFRTLGNVTGDLAATSILARNAPREDEGSRGRQLAAELRASVGVVAFDLLDALGRAFERRRCCRFPTPWRRRLAR